MEQRGGKRLVTFTFSSSDANLEYLSPKIESYGDRNDSLKTEHPDGNESASVRNPGVLG
jgi:hypothetical protein